jgi:hypothetical protein
MQYASYCCRCYVLLLSQYRLRLRLVRMLSLTVWHNSNFCLVKVPCARVWEDREVFGLYYRANVVQCVATMSKTNRLKSL